MKKLLMLLLASSFVFAQNRNPQQLLDDVTNKFESVKDYQVEVSIKIDVDFLKVPDTKAKLYFKQPDKTKFESDGFAMLPKQVFEINPGKLLSFDYTPIYVRDEKIDDINTAVIKIVPNSDSTNMLLSTVWVDVQKSRVQKIETATKQGGTMTTILAYNKESKYPLPSKVIVEFDVNAPVPTASANDQNSIVQNKRAVVGRRQLNGSVTLTYSDYKINEGIPDSLFEEKAAGK